MSSEWAPGGCWDGGGGWFSSSDAEKSLLGSVNKAEGRKGKSFRRRSGLIQANQQCQPSTLHCCRCRSSVLKEIAI